MATLSSNFESIRECRNQVYVIERELIIFTTLIVINNARLRNFDALSLHSVSDIHPVCTAECRASLVEVKLLCYLGRPSKGQTEGAISVDDHILLHGNMCTCSLTSTHH